MKKWYKQLTAFVVMFAAVFSFTIVASAHVVVHPGEVEQGSYEVFTLRVPTEEDQPTVAVKIEIPDNVEISRVEAKPGWSYELGKNENDKVTSITWSAEGTGIKPHEFADFNMQGKVSDEADSLIWKAYQTYKDGRVVEWTGPEGSDRPASVTKVLPKNKSDQGDTEKAIDQQTSPDQETENGTDNLPLYLSIAALVLGGIALVIAVQKK